MADFTSDENLRHVASLPAEKRGQHMRDIARGVHRIIGADGKTLSFDAGPTTATVAAAPPVIERKALVPHHGSPASIEIGSTRGASLQADAPSTSRPPYLSADDQRGFDTFAKSFEELPPAERNAALQKLAEVYIPRLIHD